MPAPTRKLTWGHAHKARCRPPVGEQNVGPIIVEANAEGSAQCPRVQRIEQPEKAGLRRCIRPGELERLQAAASGIVDDAKMIRHFDLSEEIRNLDGRIRRPAR